MKEDYINLLKKVDKSGKYLELINPFIETYDGTNEREFKGMMIALVGILIKLNEYETSQEFGTKIEDVIGEYKGALSVIKQDFELIQAGENPTEHAVMSDSDITQED
jgi:hypothetical protein